jgi:hypothetical protein
MWASFLEESVGRQIIFLLVWALSSYILRIFKFYIDTVIHAWHSKVKTVILYHKIMCTSKTYIKMLWALWKQLKFLTKKWIANETSSKGWDNAGQPCCKRTFATEISASFFSGIKRETMLVTWHVKYLGT